MKFFSISMKRKLTVILDTVKSHASIEARGDTIQFIFVKAYSTNIE